jgi:hypothetical protein
VSETRLYLTKDAAPISGRQAQCFRFSACRYDPASGEALLCYEIDGRELQERIVFPYAPWPVDASRQAAFMRALELLHLIAGISYYKAGLAVRTDTGESRVDEEMAGFLNGLYLNGLAEFAYVNGLDLSGLIEFRVNTGAASLSGDDAAYPVDLPERALVAMGGGKDSLVCLQMLKTAGIEVQPACVGGSMLIGETVRASGLPLIRIRRTLAAELAAMNRAGAWNGHVPVTAINSAILLCAGLLYGYRYIVFANESSASEATLEDGQGREINHQYSKSLAFEKAFAAVVAHHVTPGIEYFSLLRPYSELAIAARFAKMTELHEVFSSCNRNFHQDGAHISGRWCLDCPKCRFAALALAPFLSPQQLRAIQGADLLDEEDQLDGFKSLCGLDVPKPFECVGSVAESRAAIRFLANDPRWRDRKIVRALADAPGFSETPEIDTLLGHISEHRIPAAILEKLHAF